MDPVDFVNLFNIPSVEMRRILDIFNGVPGIYYFYGTGKETFLHLVLTPLLRTYHLSSPEEEFEYEMLKYKYYHLFYIREGFVEEEHLAVLASRKPVIILCNWNVPGENVENYIVLNTDYEGFLLTDCRFSCECIDYLKMKTAMIRSPLR